MNQAVSDLYKAIYKRLADEIQTGLLAERPITSGSPRFFFATDTDELWFDTAAGWVLVNPTAPAGTDELFNSITDGSTTVSPVRDLVITGGTVQDNGSDEAEIIIVAGSSLTVGDTPDTATGVDEILFVGATVDDDGGGHVTVTIPGGSGTFTTEAPAGAIDSSNLVYTILNTPLEEGLLTINEAVMIYTTHYTRSGTTITLVAGQAPDSGDLIRYRYRF